MANFTLLKGTLIDTTSTDDITNTSSLDGGTLTETLENLAEADVVHKAGEEIITGPKLFTATTTFQGDVIQQGTTYTTHAEQVYTTKDTIIMRDGALTGLADGVYSGLTAKLYDGANDGQLVFDNKGVARVGDVESLQPLATREETPTDGYYAKWSYANQKFETTQVHSDEVVNDSNGVGTNVSDVLDGIISGSQELDHISLDTTPTTITNTAGKLIWNSIDGCLDVYDGETKNQVGQESVVPVRNNTGAKLLNGKVVCITGSDGYYPTVELADAATYRKADSVVGVLSQDIEDGAIGKCTFNGKVRDLDTSLFNNGDTIWLSETSGDFTNVMPSHPSLPVRLGQVIEADATEGSIFVKVDFKPELLNFQIYKEPTGFFDPDNVIVTYDSSTRKVTLTGSVEAYWRGKHIPILTSGWVSDAHSTTNGIYYLYYDGDTNTFSFTSTPWSFDKLMIAFVNCGATYKWAIRECHGTMDWKSHQEFHRVIGTYKESGGELSNYVLSSTTPANRRPYVSATYIFDEDIRTINPALTTNSYTIANLTGADATNVFTLSQTDIVPLSGSNPYYNQWNGSTWVQTLMANNSYMNVWLLAIPTTADSGSQSYRYLWIQGQNNGDLPTINAFNTKDLNIGSLKDVATEVIFIAKVTIRYQAADWSIVSVTNLTGSSFSQIGTPSGSFLASVSTDATLTGNGTIVNPLSVVQNYATLTGTQTIAGTKTFSSTIIGSISGNASTATTLQTPTTIATSGGAVGTATSFNGSTNITIPITSLDSSYLNDSGVTAATYGSSIEVPVFTVSSKGLITSATNTTIRDASSSQSGVVNTTTQTFAGNKTFSSPVSINGSNYGFSTFAAAVARALYYKIATLPISSTGTYDHITLEGVLGGDWFSNTNAKYCITFANRNEFNYYYDIYGTPVSSARILAYVETNGSVSIYLYLQNAKYTKATYNITSQINTTVYSNPSATTTAPTGTLSFDTYTTVPRYKLDINGNSVTKGTITAPTFVGALSGNATTATQLQNDSGVIAGTYGSTTQVPSITIDSKGIVTSASNNNFNYIPNNKFPTFISDFIGGYTSITSAGMAGGNDDIVNYVIPISGGSVAFSSFSENHPGIASIYGSTSSTGVGASFSSYSRSYYTGGEIVEIIFKIRNISSIITYLGFGNNSKTYSSGNCGYIKIVGSTLVGEYINTVESSSPSSTLTNYTVSENVWYKIKIVHNASSLEYYLYDSFTDNLLWNETILTSLPSLAYFISLYAINSSTVSPSLLIDIDYVSLRFSQELNR